MNNLSRTTLCSKIQFSA